MANRSGLMKALRLVLTSLCFIRTREVFPSANESATSYRRQHPKVQGTKLREHTYPFPSKLNSYRKREARFRGDNTGAKNRIPRNKK
jgi:hypothetical protein